MKSVFLKQSKPIKALVLGYFLLTLSALMLIGNPNQIPQIVFLTLFGSLIVFGSVSMEIRKDYKNKKHFQLFGITIFKYGFNIPPPEYIVIFFTKQKSDNDWGPVSAMGTTSKDQLFILRIFYKKLHFTLLRTKDAKLAKQKGKELSSLLNVELFDKTI
ncbi:hypothetical protein [Spongiivirga citrea]|uniref:Uncharacterized protein n=1 Tax=Spongiivirga citrea TaxID=1481457 RepID=A0A6M0CNG2_9FLAO|nr:hypothetical protein [Spongiivirga citrea]NER17399.1 hypothetical protein [Spongiivirga citrea]